MMVKCKENPQLIRANQLPEFTGIFEKRRFTLLLLTNFQEENVFAKPLLKMNQRMKR